MGNQRGKTVFYKRSHFVTHLPVNAVYSPSHSWLLRDEAGVCRIGLTKFATRMLGEMVDHKFEVSPEASVGVGQIIGWVEGFKAISDIYAIASGAFLRSNPALQEEISLVSDDPYGDGWLYEVRGEASERCLDVDAYSGVLSATIDKILEEQQTEGNKWGT
ncbi:MAG: Glycine cleavage system H protein [Verrucomicrobia subdivision 3 bacterium]|nr:Glycine cleavage system H protein [Limisphaerales bacterium]MCS1415415.1 Glycine cleavage system H protein [Limisphaerales bacterium]